LIARDVAQEAAEREAGLKTRPPGVVLLADLTEVWPGEETFVATRLLVSLLIDHNPDYWGKGSSYGKELTEQRFGRMLVQAANAMSVRPGGSASPRGYLRSQLEPVWDRLGIPHHRTGRSGQAGRTGREDREDDRSDRFNRSDRFDTDTPAAVFTPPSGPGRCRECGCHVAAQGHRDGCSANTPAHRKREAELAAMPPELEAAARRRSLSHKDAR
jgi:hypothetical protein